ncbi:MAG: hypothetical protein RBR87_15745 [Bacteroidales bacterium]|jgi:hypothetical protein|nr:hypothetical protein [Bacteroidales bacterium]
MSTQKLRELIMRLVCKLAAKQKNQKEGISKDEMLPLKTIGTCENSQK